jgi:CRP/FNR family transcriptional regulator, nitrogen oxide reductase regulator
MSRARELATERVAQRVARNLLRLARQSGREADGGLLIGHPLSRQELAAMAGTTLYTVSRLLSQWEEAGIVETGRLKVLVRSPARLAELAET